MTTKQKLVTGSIFLLMAFIIGSLFWELFKIKYAVASAVDQIEIYDSMALQSNNATVEDIISHLELTVKYYPTGTKQKTGSRLDKIVENNRAKSIEKIIEILKTKTKDNLGSDPEIWIAKYKNKS